MSPLDYVLSGVLAVFLGPEAFSIFGIGVPITVLMVAGGFLTGIVIGATPGLNGPFVMAVSLPILISVFGFTPDALLPVMGFLVGVMKGSTVGGAAPAILFNTPGTPDALMTTLDGYPMTQKGESGKALRVAHLSSASGDTFSDLVLFTTAPFLAIVVERHLGFGEKAALIILSLSFVAAVVGSSPFKGLMAAFFGILVASVGTGEDLYSRLSLGAPFLAGGFPLISVVLGTLVIGELLVAFEKMWAEGAERYASRHAPRDSGRLAFSEVRRLFPFIGVSSVIGTVVGALPGIGSTLAATLGYAAGQRMHKGPVAFGKGAPEGVAATEAANSSVAGANLIPVLSLGIPGNVGAVFLILAADSIGGFNPGPEVFRFSADEVNAELVFVFGFFTAMMLANLLNWAVGGRILRGVSVMARVPRHVMLPMVFLLTFTAIYVQETDAWALAFTLGFGVLGYLMRKLGFPILPFIISFILAGNLETAIRQAFSVSDADPFFLLRSPISAVFLGLSVFVVLFFARSRRKIG